MVCRQVEDSVLLDCYNTSVYSDTTTIRADPDIAGVGVISAFMVTAGLALVLSFLYILLDSDSKVDQFVKNKKGWLHLLQSLILTLSDQQLVTGLAILIAAFVRWNTITVYHWEIVTDLAFMSSNTHICTLVILRRPFRRDGWWWIRLWRIIAMAVLAILLFVANIYTGYRYWENSTAWPIRCVAQELKRDPHGNFRGSQASLAGVWSGFLVTNYPIAVLGLFENVCGWTRDLLQRKRDKTNRLYQELKANRQKVGSSLRWRMRKLYVDAYGFGLFLISFMHSNWFFILENLFWYLFNIIYLFNWRKSYQCGLDEPGKEDDVTGFGQILPIVLLLLPFMQFTESWSSF